MDYKVKLPLTLLLLITSGLMSQAGAAMKADSLLEALDRNIARRYEYTLQKEEAIEALKRKKTWQRSLDELYAINRDIISSYESFVCDSAEFYVHQNIDLARRLQNEDYLSESHLKLAFIYSLSGLFLQADDIFRTVDYEALPSHHRIAYCWSRIRYYENLIKYTDDPKFSDDYHREIYRLRDSVMHMLPETSDEYRKEYAFKLQERGEFDAAIEILSEIYRKQSPGTHTYAMAAMSLAKVYRQSGYREEENNFLKLAAISDTKLAVKENEALLTLAMNLFEEGDVDRSYNYINVALADANFYNSRFRNTVIARVQPVIESNYLYRIKKQKGNLRLSAVLLSLVVIALIITLSINFRQIKIVTKARRNLRLMNDKLTSSNRKLDESNIIKEKYIGYFMNQCAFYINKLDEYRKDVNHKIKNGQIERLYKPSSKELEKEVEELFENFDQAFLKLYPDYVREFNALLRPEHRYSIEKYHLNTELRIFALMRLGITDPNQIAVFLRCSVQTIYNYRSKLKGKALNKGEQFESDVRKLGALSLGED